MLLPKLLTEHRMPESRLRWAGRVQGWCHTQPTAYVPESLAFRVQQLCQWARLITD